MSLIRNTSLKRALSDQLHALHACPTQTCAPTPHDIYLSQSVTLPNRCSVPLALCSSVRQALPRSCTFCSSACTPPSVHHARSSTAESISGMSSARMCVLSAFGPTRLLVSTAAKTGNAACVYILDMDGTVEAHVPRPPQRACQMQSNAPQLRMAACCTSVHS